MATYGPDVLSVEGPVLEQVRYFPTEYERTFNNCVDAADDEKSSMLLVMRVLSIVPLNFKVRKRNHK